jgi:hypothetical protein
MPYTPRRTRPYNPDPITDLSRYFSGPARIARLIVARRKDDDRTNNQLAAAVNLNNGCLLSMLKDVALGRHGSKPVNDEHLVLLASELGLEIIKREMNLLLIEDQNAGCYKDTIDLIAESDPHTLPIVGLVRAMADRIVQIPPGTDPGIVAKIEQGRRDGEQYIETWKLVERTLTDIWKAKAEAGEVIEPYGPQAHADRAMAENYVASFVA